ncbi:MAG: hypothetical protein ABIG61_12025 [Planctomycetota bacterium]
MYAPDKNIEQANELWEALPPTIHVTIETIDNWATVTLRDIEDPDWLVRGEGRKWPAALVVAMAKMQAEKEK